MSGVEILSPFSLRRMMAEKVSNIGMNIRMTGMASVMNVVLLKPYSEMAAMT